MQLLRTANKCNAPVPQRSQMLHSLSYAVMIVHLQHTNTRASRTDIDKHERQLTLGELLEQWFFDAKNHDRDAVDLAFQHAANAMRHPLRIIVCGTDQDLVAVFNCYIF